jgi:hypothetical protein
VPAWWLDVILAGIAMFMAVPAPWSPRAKVAYLIVVALLLAAVAYARKREERRREWVDADRRAAERNERNEQEVRDIERHRESMDQQQQNADSLREDLQKTASMLQNLVLVRPVVAQTGPVGAPLLGTIDDRTSFLLYDWMQHQQRLASIMAMQGHTGPQGPLGPEDLTMPKGVAGSETRVELQGIARATPGRSFGTLTVSQLEEATRLVKEIRLKPPTTPEAVAAASEQLHQSLTPATAGVLAAVQAGKTEILAAIFGKTREELANEASNLAAGIQELLDDDLAQQSHEPGPPFNTNVYRSIHATKLVLSYLERFSPRVHKLLGACNYHGLAVESRLRDAHNDPHNSSGLYAVVNGLRALERSLRKG